MWPRAEVANACVAIGRPEVATKWQEGRTGAGGATRGTSEGGIDIGQGGKGGDRGSEP